jgi:hypothetical protein
LPSTGRDLYILFGSFSASVSDGPAAWTPFATIKTGDYEQWLGGQAQGLCDMPEIAWLPGDGTRRLTERVAARR